MKKFLLNAGIAVFAVVVFTNFSFAYDITVGDQNGDPHQVHLGDGQKTIDGEPATVMSRNPERVVLKAGKIYVMYIRSSNRWVAYVANSPLRAMPRPIQGRTRGGMDEKVDGDLNDRHNNQSGNGSSMDSDSQAYDADLDLLDEGSLVQEETPPEVNLYLAMQEYFHSISRGSSCNTNE